MSAKLMGQVWDLDIPHGEAWVLLALADHADHEGRNAYPGVELLAYKTNYSVRQVQRILVSLEKKQIIKPVANEKGGRSARTVYEIHLENGVKKSPFRSVERVTGSRPLNTEKGDICDTKRVTFQAEKGDICDTLYKEEPSGTVRGNREAPALRTDSLDDLGEVLEEIYPGHATNFKVMRELHDLVVRVKGTTADVRKFSGWLKAHYPMKANTVFTFKDLFHESLSAPKPTTAPAASQAPDWYRKLYEAAQ